LCTCRRHYPGAAAGRIPRSSHPAVTAFPGRGRRVGLHIDLFEACSAFTRVAACTLARSPIRDPLSEGFRHFVASMPAPVASGGSEAPGGACTHWKAPPCHGAPPLPSFGQGPRERTAAIRQSLGGPPSIIRRAGWLAANGTLNAATGCVKPLSVKAPMSSRVTLSLRRAATRWLIRI